MPGKETAHISLIITENITIQKENEDGCIVFSVSASACATVFVLLCVWRERVY